MNTVTSTIVFGISWNSDRGEISVDVIFLSTVPQHDVIVSMDTQYTIIIQLHIAEDNIFTTRGHGKC